MLNVMVTMPMPSDHDECAFVMPCYLCLFVCLFFVGVLDEASSIEIC